VDPVSLNPDPDTAFQENPGVQVVDDQKLKKKNAAKIFQKSFLIKNCNLLMSKLQEKPSAPKREHPALQKIKFIIFFYVYGSIANPDPDTDPGIPVLRIRIRDPVPF
jgi:hypothetical protein